MTYQLATPEVPQAHLLQGRCDGRLALVCIGNGLACAGMSHQTQHGTLLEAQIALDHGRTIGDRSCAKRTILAWFARACACTRVRCYHLPARRDACKSRVAARGSAKTVTGVTSQMGHGAAARAGVTDSHRSRDRAPAGSRRLSPKPARRHAAPLGATEARGGAMPQRPV